METLRCVALEAPFVLTAARERDARAVRAELRLLRERVVEAAARDIAWLLPPRVALWAYIRVVAHASQTKPFLHPEEITYGVAYDRWVQR